MLGIGDIKDILTSLKDVLTVAIGKMSSWMVFFILLPFAVGVAFGLKGFVETIGRVIEKRENMRTEIERDERKLHLDFEKKAMTDSIISLYANRDVIGAFLNGVKTGSEIINQLKEVRQFTLAGRSYISIYAMQGSDTTFIDPDRVATLEIFAENKDDSLMSAKDLIYGQNMPPGIKHIYDSAQLVYTLDNSSLVIADVANDPNIKYRKRTREYAEAFKTTSLIILYLGEEPIRGENKYWYLTCSYYSKNIKDTARFRRTVENVGFMIRQNMKLL